MRLRTIRSDCIEVTTKARRGGLTISNSLMRLYLHCFQCHASYSRGRQTVCIAGHGALGNGREPILCRRLQCTASRLMTAGAVYAATDGRGIWASEDGGTIWTRLAGLDDEPLLSVLPVNRQTILAGTGGRGLFISRDGGSSWQMKETFHNEYVSLIVGDPGNEGTIYRASEKGLFRSLDGGETWPRLGGGIQSEIVTALDFFDDMIVAGSSGGKIMTSRDHGTNWQGMQVENPRRRAILSFLAIDQTLYAGYFDGLLRSEDSGARWQVLGRGLGNPIVHAFAFGENGNVYAGAQDGLYIGMPAEYQRIEFGADEVPVTAVAVAANAVAVAPNAQQRIYVGTDGKGVFVSDDGGQTWDAAGGELGDKGRIAQLVVDPFNAEIVFARVMFERIYKSMDGGDTWRTVWTGMPIEEQLQSIVYCAGRAGGHVRRW